MAALNDATRILSVIDQRIKDNTGSNITQTYGQIESITGDTAAVWIAGSREIAAAEGEVAEALGGFRVPAWMVANVGDFCRVAVQSTGGGWIEEIIPQATYARMSVDVTSGKIRVGDGVNPPTSGTEGNVLAVGSDGSLTYADQFGTTFVPFVYNSLSTSATVQIKPIDAGNTSTTPRIMMPWNFEVVGITIRSSDARSAGTLVATPTINGNPVNFGATLDGTNTTTVTAKGSRFATANKGTAGQEIGVSVTTSSFAPTTAYIAVGVFVIIHYSDPITIVNGSFTANAIIRTSFAGGFVFTADAVIRKTASGTLSADAVLVAPSGPPAPAGSGAVLGSSGAILGSMTLGKN